MKPPKVFDDRMGELVRELRDLCQADGATCANVTESIDDLIDDRIRAAKLRWLDTTLAIVIGAFLALCLLAVVVIVFGLTAMEDPLL